MDHRRHRLAVFVAAILSVTACSTPGAASPSAVAPTTAPSVSAAASAAPSAASAAPSASASASETPAGDLTSLEGKRIGVIYLNQTSPFQITFAKQFQTFADENGFELLGRDGKQDGAVQAALMEELIVQQVDGIVIQPINGPAVVPLVLQAQEAGIAVVLNALRIGPGAEAPFAGLEEGVVSERAGTAAAEYFEKHFGGDVPAKIIVVECPISTASEPRSLGFIKGYQATDPDAEVLARIDGKCAQEDAVTAMEDALQLHRDVNVVYGNNSQNALGALAALEGAGMGTPDKVLLISHAGSEPEVLEIVDPESAMKMAAGTSPRGLVQVNLETLAGVFAGTVPIDENTDHYLPETVPSADDPEGLCSWVKDELLSTASIPDC